MFISAMPDGLKINCGRKVGLGAWFVFPAAASEVFNSEPDSFVGRNDSEDGATNGAERNHVQVISPSRRKPFAAPRIL